MRTAGAARGLMAVVAIVALGVMGMAQAQDRPATDPVPRPLEIAALQAAAPAPSLPETAPAPETAAEAAPDTAGVMPASATAAGPRVGPVTGFPLPRYVSIDATEANARRGPSRSHRIDWVFQRRNMPVMVVAEHGHWRRVVDRDGAGGWMHYTLLSGVRTAIVEVDMLPLHARPDRASLVRAQAERGVIGQLRQCRPGWCEMEVGGFRGWVEADAIWGVDPGETFDD